MNVSGILIGVRRYKFPDRETGEIRQGAKVLVAAPGEDGDTAGSYIQEIPAKYEMFDELAKQASSAFMKKVTVVCDATLRGKYTRLNASGIQAV